MTQNKKIAVTGGIGSGKTLFCNIVKDMGFAVYSCDQIYAEMMGEESYLLLLKKRFPQCFTEAGIDKKRLSNLVFSDSAARRSLDDLAHPLIMERLMRKMAGDKIAFAEVPLLFEGGYEKLFDHTVALVRSREKRIESVIRRSGLSETEIIGRMNSQFDPAMLKTKNCLIVENDGTKEQLKKKAEELLSQITT